MSGLTDSVDQSDFVWPHPLLGHRHQVEHEAAVESFVQLHFGRHEDVDDQQSHFPSSVHQLPIVPVCSDALVEQQDVLGYFRVIESATISV